MVTLKPRVLVLARHFSEKIHSVEAKLRELNVPVGLIDIDALMRGEGKISSEHDGKSQRILFTDARTSQAMSDDEVSGIWLQDMSFVQVPMEKSIDGQDGRAYIEHIGQCEAWMAVMAIVGAAGHNRVCLPNPQFTYLDTPLRYLQLAKRIGIPTLPMCATRGPGPIYDFLPECSGHLRRVPFRRFAFRYRDKRYLSTESIIEADRSFALGWIRGAEMFTDWPQTWSWYRVAQLGTKKWALKLSLKPDVGSAQITDIAYQAALGQLDLEPVELGSAMSEAFDKLCRSTQSPYLVADFVEDAQHPEHWFFINLSTKDKLTLFDKAGLNLSGEIARWLESGTCPS